MFILTKIADLVQIKPQDFRKESLHAIEDNINSKYANKVIQKIGLCICLYDLLWASEGLIGHSTGLVNVNVEFRLVVFRPFKGEVLLGQISSCSPQGIHLRTNFFEDIFVDSTELPENCEYDQNEQVWVWHSEGQELYWDTMEWVRFAVIGEEWHDQTPTKPNVSRTDESERRTAPYRLKGSMKDTGLGIVSWWD